MADDASAAVTNGEPHETPSSDAVKSVKVEGNESAENVTAVGDGQPEGDAAASMKQEESAEAAETSEAAGEGGDEQQQAEGGDEQEEQAGGEEQQEEEEEEVEDVIDPDEPALVTKMRDSGHFSNKALKALKELLASGNVAETDLDERTMEMLCSFAPEHMVWLLNQFRTMSMLGVNQPASYVGTLVRNFRDRVRTQGPHAAVAAPIVQAADPEKLKKLSEEMNCEVEVTVGQRKFGPPKDYEGDNPSGKPGHECYIGHVPKDMFEDEVVPIFSEAGKVYDLRLMMDPITGTHRGYGFVLYCEPCAKEAAKKFDGYEIKPGKKLKVNMSVANTRIFLGNIPKSKTSEDIKEELSSQTDGVHEVIVYASADDPSKKNRGFCFVDFVDHKTASDAKRRLSQGKVRLFNSELVIDWADTQEEVDEQTMSKVKVLYVRNLKSTVTDEQLRELFGLHGEIERIHKVKDFAFVHFNERESAEKALAALHDTELEGVKLEVTLARPQTEKKRGGRSGRIGLASGWRGGGNWGRGGQRGGWRGAGGGGWGRGGGYPPAAGFGGGYGGYGGYDPYGGYGMGYGGYGGGFAQQGDPYGDFAYGGYDAYGSGGGFGFGGGRGAGFTPRGGRGFGGGGFRARGADRGGRGFGRARGRGDFRGAKRPANGNTGGPGGKRSNVDYSADGF